MITVTQVSIGQVKRDISDLVNRVAYRGERIVLTSRGKPKAALVSIEDYERLEREQSHDSLARWHRKIIEKRAFRLYSRPFHKPRMGQQPI